MQSEFDILASEFCAEVLSEQFGLRDANSELAKLVYQPPNAEPVELVGWVVTSISGQEQVDERMQVILAETSTITGPAQQLCDHKITRYQREARVTIGDVEYHLDPLTTKFTEGGALVTLGLKRKPLLATHEGRHA